ncbi:MAG: radical SAM protein [Verrucomicrobiae bacterium]|nr:radical SAM protein [Verrucomicrobiae bacterium]
MDRWQHPDVFFAGGEPTVMENLPQIIALTRAKGKRPYIVTNGLRLAEPRYVAELARSGLHGVSLSLNALDGKTLEATDGRDYLAAKLQAVSNLKRHLRRFAVCFSLVRGVNEAEFGKVFRFALRQYPFARSFHAECLPGIGRSMNSNRMFLSQMLGMLADNAGLTRARLLELAAKGKATVGAYGFAADYRDLGARRLGWMSGAAMTLTKLIRSRRPDFRVRVLAGPLPDSVDLEEIWSATTTMAVSRESPVMPLWEYLIRYHGRQHERA